jgi:hypothetical protein
MALMAETTLAIARAITLPMSFALGRGRFSKSARVFGGPYREINIAAPGRAASVTYW